MNIYIADGLCEIYLHVLPRYFRHGLPNSFKELIIITNYCKRFHK